MCGKHYAQFKKYGKTLDTNPRTPYDPNEIRLNKEYGEIDTYDRDNNVNYTFKFDLEDKHLLEGHKWRAIDKRGVPYLGTGHTIYFHRLVCPCDSKYTVDHISRDTTDNRKCNLRIADASTQQVNQNVQKNNTCGFTGTYYSKLHNNWHAELIYQKKRYYGPNVQTLEEAVYSRVILETIVLGKLLRPENEYKEQLDKISETRKSELKKFIENKYL